ncbi:addiction module protein [Candidatus Sumerlaeota bacterium]|nr:addiction module protein [Candidatus Sumerlaeota bacterium]
MSVTTANRIINSALRQPEKERARIAETLIASLDAAPTPEVERAWQEEIDGRLREIDSGVIECTPWEQVRDRLYRNAHVRR